MRQKTNKLMLPADEDYLTLVQDLLDHEQVKKMHKYIQHGETTTLQHCINVSYMAYCYCEKKGLDSGAAARAGLLHDFFLYDWHDKNRGPRRYIHGFTHGKEATKNAKKFFDLNQVEQDGIMNHMWPLTIKPPKTKIGFVIQMCDKKCGFYETVGIDVLRIEDEGYHFNWKVWAWTLLSSSSD